MEEALNAVHDYYFGVPTIVDGWIFPFHRKPDLDREAALIALRRAVRVSKKDLERIREKRHAQVFGTHAPLVLTAGKSRWEKVQQSGFRSFASVEGNATLYLRRDLEEAYIVRGH